MFYKSLLVSSILAIILVSSGCSKRTNTETTITTSPPCTLNLAQAPELRGFKLGMKMEEAKARFPKDFTFFTDKKYGLEEFHILRMPEHKDVWHLYLYFVDKEVAAIEVHYYSTDDSFYTQFLKKTREAMNLDAEWQRVSDEEKKRLESDQEYLYYIDKISCNGFTVYAGRKIEKSGLRIDSPIYPFIRIEHSEAMRKPQQREQEEEQNRKMRVEEYKRRQQEDFKP